MDNAYGYNQDWSGDDMIRFIGNVVNEQEVICRWVNNGVLCNDSVKGKDVRFHLHHRHGVTSEAQLYRCYWYECSTEPMRRSSLERHVRERHVPAKWACPYCTLTFTRDDTMKDHIGRTHGHAAG